MSPNAPRADNPARAVRVEDELWDRVKRLAAVRKVPVSVIVREALTAYVRSHGKKS